MAYTYKGKPVFCRDLNAQGAMTALLRDALQPNLVQTLEHTPALIHGGPFANIAHGCNSVIATRLAMRLADYTITEAGFGADLGAEKFLDIKCRKAGIAPSAVVLVATIRALKYNGGVEKEALGEENLEALARGIVNLEAHIDNLTLFGVPLVVALNAFPTDTERETAFIENFCRSKNIAFAISHAFAEGGMGAVDLAEAVVNACELESCLQFLYPDEASYTEKIAAIAKKLYGAAEVRYETSALRSLREIEMLGEAYQRMPVCMAKTQYSLSDDPARLGRPQGYTLTVRDVRLSAGAEFLVVYTGKIMTMPGLPKIPAAEQIDVDCYGRITGLF